MNRGSFSGKTFVELLAARALEQPERVALRFLGDGESVTTSFTYAELHHRVRSVAAHLRARCAPGDRALLLYQTGPEYVLAFLGCLQAGVIAVPAYPPESLQRHHVSRLIGIARDAAPRLILTDQALLEPLEAARRAVPELASASLLATDTLALEEAQPSSLTVPDTRSIAFLQYTSGSTARPKGVMVGHDNLIANSLAIRQAFEINEDDVVVSWLPLFHDMGLIGGLLQPIFSGVPLVLMASRHFIERPARWLSAIARFGGTVSGGPDFAYRLCLERVSPEQLQGVDLSSWRLAFSGAEPVRAATLRAFAEKFAGFGFDAKALYPCYGLAESTLLVTGGRRGGGVDVTAFDAERLAQGSSVPNEAGPGLVACGRAQQGHRVVIVDPSTGELARAGSVGEIQVAGGSVAHGYWNNSTATQETFIAREGERFLRTGDLGFEHDGRLFVTGRHKDMIIIRGQNLYPQDVEKTVEDQIEVVRKGRVAAFPVEIAGQEGIGIAAEVSRRVQKLVSPDALCRAISEAVAEAHQEPASVVVLLQPGGLPITTSGKLQRAACRRGWQQGSLDTIAICERGTLRAPEPSGAVAERPGAAASVLSATERELAPIWQEVLNVPAIASDDRFFALGGSSLKAVQMLARVAATFGVRAELSKLFDAPTLAGFALEIERLRRSGSAAGAPAIARVPREPRIPLSFGEQRLWFLWQIEPDSVAYTMAEGLRFRGALDEHALEQCLQLLARRHEALRTTFFETEGTPYRVIREDSNVLLPIADLREHPEAEREARARALADAETSALFDLVQGPLWRTKLIRLADDHHLLLLTMHHIVSDGWSMGVLMEELCQAYASYSQGREPEAAELPVQYADYAVWQRQSLDAAELERQLGYWKSVLGAEQPVLELPTDRPRPAVQSHRGERQALSIDAVLTRQLTALSREQNVTLFMLLLAAFQVLLHRYSGLGQIRVGVPVANRQRLELERVVGFLVNTLVLSVDVSDSPSFTALLARVRTSALAAQAHQDLPFERLVDALSPERTLKHNPLFQVMYNHLKPEYGALRSLPGLEVSRFEQASLATQFDLTLDTFEEGGEIRAFWTYSTDLFDASTIQTLAEQFRRLLEAIVERPEQRIQTVPLLGAAESERVLEAWNQSEHEYPFEQGYVGLFEERVTAHGERIAAVCGQQRVSYAELNGRANRLGHALLGAGVKPGEVVALLGERGLGFLSMIVGVFKAGGAYVPLDGKHPAERTAQLLKLSAARVMVVEARSGEALSEALERLSEAERPRVLVLEEVLSGNYPEHNPGIRVRREDLAYVIWTSGSTGVPKGAMVTSQGMLNNQLSKVPYLGLGAGDVVAQTASQSFDISVWQFLAGLLCGARVEIVPDEVAQDGSALLRHVNETGITVLEIVPSLLQGMLSEEPVELGSLRWLLPTGEALSPELARRWFARYPQIPLVNAYGPAECADDVALYRMDAAPAADTVHLPIGRPTDNNRLYILNQALQPVPVGVTGELCVAGVGVGRGYLGDAARTAEAFVPSPYAKTAGERLYRTGDLARYRADGVIEYVGRRDQQVKIRGYRIELGEVEERLQEQELVTEAAVLVWSDDSGDKRLVAYVVPTGKLPTTDAESSAFRERLRAELGAALPEYMVPQLYVLLEKLPVTANGKLDRKALPAPDLSQAQKSYVAPEGELERQIAEIWCEVLRLERVGRDDDFFELGGHSLLATQVVSRVNKRFAIEVPLRALFDERVLARFALQVGASLGQRTNAQKPPVIPVDRSQPLRLSYAQQRLWFLWHLEPDNAVYNLTEAAHWVGEVDAALLTSAFSALVARHESLRTTFQQEQGEAYQLIHEPQAVDIPLIDLQAHPASERQARALDLVEQEACAPFDLGRGPLLRVKLVKLAEREHIVIVTAHHIVVDGWSMHLMVEEFAKIYLASVRRQQPALMPLPVQYADYAAWQRAWLEAGEMERQLVYWRAQLGTEHPTLELPTDRPRPAVQSYRGATASFELDPELTGRLLALAQSQDATLFMLSLAAFKLLLHRYSGQSDIRVGVPITNRPRLELEPLIGFFVNTQVLRTKLGDNPSFRELLARVKEVALGAQAHQDLPFERLVEALNPERSLSHSPLFQVLYNHLRVDHSALDELGDAPLRWLDRRSHATQFDLTVNAVEEAERLKFSITYSSDLFDAETIERLARHWRALLESIAASSEERIGQLALLREPELHELLAQRGETTEPARRALHELVEEQVARAPQAVAVRFGASELSYAQLNAQANRLARKLRDAGVGPDVLVAVCAQRSLETVTLFLAILKAGGAYLPIDPALPEDRIRYLLADAAPRVVLTQRQWLQQLPAAALPVWCWERDAGELEAYDSSNLPNAVRDQNLAYCIYTSGSTGKPKAALLTHAAIVNHMAWMSRAFPVGPADRVLQKTPLSFDASVWEFWLPLITGGTCVLAPPDALKDPAELLDVIDGQGVTVLQVVPSLLKVLLETPGAARSLGRLKYLFSGGEALSAELVRDVLTVREAVINLYGPTETAIDTTFWECRSARGTSTPIGLPISNTSVYVLDQYLNPVPLGVTGELYVSGAGLGRGYLNRPELTAERFVPNPYSKGERLYRTGDLARYGRDGALEYVGRGDQQVKVRGYRIELGEIEARLRELGTLREAAVEARRDGSKERRLVAYVVPNDQTLIAAPSEVQRRYRDDLQQRLRATLPDYMVPQVYLLLERLPLLASGKLDRKALPAPEVSIDRVRYVAPSTDSERKLARIWGELLTLEPVSVRDNFFELGGDSIVALQVIARARALGLGLTPKDLFQHQTVESLAAVAKQGPLLVAEQGVLVGDLPLSPIQHWFFEQRFARPEHWNQALLLEIPGGLELGALEGALRALVRHHDALRLRYRFEGGAWKQWYGEESDAPLCRSVDLSAEPDSASAIERVANDAQASLSLERGPALRAAHLDLGTSARLLIVIHHLVVDTVSWRILLEDLQAAYEALASGRVPELPAKTSSFKQWAERLQASAETGAFDQQLGYWRELLASAEPDLPVARPVGENVVASARTFRIELDEAETERLLTQSSQAYRTQIDDLLLTALSQTLCSWAHRSSMLIHLEGHGREDLFEDVDVTRTVGWFTTLFPVRLSPDAQDVGKSIQSIKAQLRSVPQRGLGYGVLRYLSRAGESFVAAPPARVIFNYLGQFDATLRADGPFRLAQEGSGRDRSPLSQRECWFDVSAAIHGRRLSIEWGYSESLHSDQEVRALAQRYAQELRALIRHCASPDSAGLCPSDFPLARLSQAEIDALRLSPRQIEDLYPLSPMQEGMLFHSLLDPGSGVYINQRRVELTAPLDASTLTAALQRVMEAHELLRTAFVWRGLERPVQIVCREVTAPVHVLDWRAQSTEQQEVELTRLLDEDRRRGFDLERAPLLRLTLIELGNGGQQLIWTEHHLLLDGWSSSELLGQLFAQYEAVRAGRQLALTRAGRYRDYIAWLAARDRTAAEAFFSEYLDGFDAQALLSSRVQPHARRKGYGSSSLLLSRRLSERLEQVALQQRLTLNTLMQGAVAVLLGTYTQTSDVVFGTTVSGRSAPIAGIEQLLGLFINTLPLRVRLEPGLRVTSWLQELQTLSAKLREYESTPLVDIQRLGGAGGQALFDTVLVFENYPTSLALEGVADWLRVESTWSLEQTSYPLTITVSPGERVSVQFDYDFWHIDKALAEKLLGELEQILVALTEDEGKKLAQLSPLTAADRERVARDWNQSEREYPFEQGYVGLLEERVAAHGERIAAACGDQRLSYAELNARANRVGHALLGAGVKPGEVVALLGERGLGFLSMIVGVFKAGGAYVPLDGKHPAERTAQLLELSAARAVVVEARSADPLLAALERLREAERPQVLVLERVLSGDYPEHNPGVRVRREDLAYVIWTSGSTGVPKGAMVTSQGMLNNQLSKVPYLGLGAGDVIAQTASASFDISVWQFLAGALCGARVEIVPDEVAQDGSALLRHVNETGITVLEIVPSLLQGMLSEEPIELGSLRWLLPTGEALSPELARRWFARYPQIPLVNAYGPAECADDVALYRIDQPPAADMVHLPIGRPTDNNRLYILNAALQPVPVGVTGELCVAGVGVGRGYLGDAARTAEAFVPSPYAKTAGERLYRTGDLARYRADGVIEYVGRRDQQVKIRGYRIELGEVEERLLEQELVVEAAVLAWSDDSGDKRLVAYVVPTGELPTAEAESSALRERLRAELGAALPEYMVPQLYVLLEQLPVTANGKLDRKALPAPDLSQAQKSYVAPEGELERQIAEIWCEVLRLERVGRDDDFFELGGHSLLATQVVSRIAKRCAIEVPLRTLFDAKTLRELAGQAARISAKNGDRGATPILARDRSQRLPLSFAQQRLWFLWQLEPESAAYNIATHVKLSGELDQVALERTLTTLVARHETLRTRFAASDGRAYQVVAAAAPVDVPTLDLSLEAESTRQARARELAEREVQTPFDLERDALLRVKLLKLEPSDHLLLVTMHHIISDEWSMNLLVDEFVQVYAAYRAGKAPALPKLDIQYADFAAWQRDFLESGEGDRQLEYWRGVLGSEHPVIELPSDRSRPKAQTYRGATYELELDPELCARLRAFARERGVTLFMVLLAGYVALLHRYSGQADLRIGIPVANRNRWELESLLGFFVNTLVLRAECSETTTFEELLESTKRRSLEAQAHQDLPFEKLVEALKPERDLSHSPLFQVMFNHLRPEHQALGELPELRVTRLDPEQGTTQFDLSLDTEEERDVLRAAWTYSTDLFERATIERMASHWCELLGSALRAPGTRLSALGLLSAAEREQLLSRRTLWEHPFAQGYISRFEERAAAHPERVVALQGDRSLTYCALNVLANRVGHALCAASVQPDDIVAILDQRGLSLLTSVLGVLKAGAAYLPLDPEHPPRRIAEVLGLSRVRVVVSTRALEPLLQQALSHLPTASRPELVLLDTLEQSALPEHNLSIPTGPQQLAYVIYTSGSTGTPKGAMIEQAGMLNNQVSKVAYLALGEADVIAQTASQCFDISVWQLLTAPLCGARVDIVPDEIARDPVALFAYVAERGVTVLESVPSLLRAALACETLPSPDGLALRYLLPTGEALPLDVVERWFERYPGIPLVNAYGPAECADDVALHLLRDTPQQSLRVPIGLPVDYTELFVLDPALNLVPAGVVGELCVAGVGVGRGYLGDPLRTAQSFVPNPFSNVPGSRLYRTGDLARYRADGLLEYVGRADHQVKIRGYRIELAEIEARLGSSPRVRECVVTATEVVPGEKRLVAYVVPQDQALALAATDEQAGLRDALRAELGAALPDYMVPQLYVLLEALPLSPNGKIDRKALPAPDVASIQKPYVEPSTGSEPVLARIWQDVLGVERVGVHDNFFELGGDSIVAIQVVARAARAGLRITPKQLFQHQTLGALAAATQSMQPLQLDAGPVTGSVELTPIQHWFFEQALIEPSHYNQSLLLEVSAPLELDLLEQALGHLVRQHDALRLRYREQAGTWQQAYSDDEPCYRCSRVDLSAEPDAALAIERAANEAQRSLNLTTGPLLRATYLDLGAERSGRLLLVIHHLVVDGVSWRILLEDLESIWSALRLGQPVQLPAKTTSFGRWAALLREYSNGPLVAEELGYWQGLLEAEPHEGLPVSRPEGVNSFDSVRTLTVELGEGVTEELLTRAHQAYRTQINDLLLTALAETLCQWSERDSVLIELEGHGRQDLFDAADITRTVGWFTTLHPVRITPDLAEPARSITAVKEQLRAVPRGGIGYGLLRYLSPGGRELSHVQPLVNFNYLGQFDSSFSEGGLFRPAREANGQECDPTSLRRTWLDVSGSVYGGRLELSIEYSANLHRASDVQGVLDAYAQAVERLVRHCVATQAGAVTPSDFPLARLTRGELDALPVSPRLIEDVYPLSPMQEGMLFHSLLDEGTGVYVNQHDCELNVPLDVAALRTAWQRSLEAHAVLRSVFVWDGLSRPMQVVCRRAELPFIDLDWRELSAEGQQAELERFLAQDREQGFELTRAPLLRVAVIRLGEARYRFVWTEHHLLLDGWSASQLLAEVFATYDELTRGSTSSAHEAQSRERGLAYGEYIAWLEGQDKSKAAEFWRSQLRGFVAPSLLTSHLPRPTRGGGQRSVAKVLPDELARRLASLALAQHLTLSSIVQGALAFVLGVYTRAEDVVFGTTVSGRSAPLPNIEAALGLFINTLPMRVKVDGRQRVGDWLRGIQSQSAAMREYEYASLVDIRSGAELPRGTELFDTLLVFENYPVARALEASADELGVGPVRSVEMTNYPLTFVFSQGDGARVELCYDSELVGELQAGELLQRFEQVLAGFAERAGARVADVSVLSEPERQQQLADFNQTIRDYERDLCVQQLIERQVARTPHAEAVRYDEQSLTYLELNQRANQLARKLRQLGIGPDALVGVYLERSLEMVIGLLAILKAGGAYLPLEPEHPTARIAHVLKEARPKVVLTAAALLDQLPNAGAKVWCVDRDWREIQANGSENLPQFSDGQNLAYCIYTSGSTGTPKGAGNSHAALRNRLQWMQEAYHLGAADRVLHKTPFSFDVSVWEFFWPLMTGATLVVARPGAHKDPAELAEIIRREGVTTLHFVPAMLQVFVSSGELESCVSLRRVICSGEALSSELEQEFLRRHTARLYNLYGPTEAAIDVTAWECRPDEQQSSVPIGYPIANVAIHILDRHLQPAPLGVLGELYIAGVGLARGYVNRPDLTAERFVPNPFGASGERLYRTGDLARYCADGAIEYGGRVDHQVKIRGNRIELGEVEARLAAHDDVRSAIVTAHADDTGDKRLVAYVVPTSSEQTDDGADLSERLREHVRRGLPSYMVPELIVVLEALPLNANGKVDRKALPSIERGGRRRPLVAPRTDTETKLLAIWRELLQLENIGVHDNFFELGGHSLLATQLASRIRREFVVEVPFRAVFESSSIEAIARLIEEQTAAQVSASDVSLMSDLLSELEQDQ